MSISDKVAYIKGLADGLVLDEANKQDKIIKAIIDALGDIAAEINYLEESYDDLCEQVDAVDEDLSNLEDDVYGEDELDDDEDMDDGTYYEIECPQCHETLCIDEDMLDEEITCPSCGTKIELEISEDDCCCGHDHDCDETDKEEE